MLTLQPFSKLAVWNYFKIVQNSWLLLFLLNSFPSSLINQIIDWYMMILLLFHLFPSIRPCSSIHPRDPTFSICWAWSFNISSKAVTTYHLHLLIRFSLKAVGAGKHGGWASGRLSCFHHHFFVESEYNSRCRVILSKIV